MAAFSTAHSLDMRKLTYEDLTPGSFEGGDFSTIMAGASRIRYERGDALDTSESYVGSFSYTHDAGGDVKSVSGLVTFIDFVGTRPFLDEGGGGEEEVAYTLSGFSVPLSIFDNASARAISARIFAADDAMLGSDEDDVLLGFDGNDVLYGRSGSDTLDGGAGVDTMVGGFGDDRFVVDRAGDVVLDDGYFDKDTVASYVSYELGTNLENLTLLGSAAVNATGNSLRNVLVGNAADNILDGKRGADTLKGGAGNDTYHVDNVRDVISGESKAGTSGDRVVSSLTWSLAGDYVERLALTGDKDIDGTGNTLANAISGNGADNVLTGMAGNDSLSGGAGNDVLVGGAGADKLTGGSGWDRFTFNAASESSRSASDRIVDFDNSRDWIDLSSFDADSAAAGRQSFTFIGEAAFAADGTAQLRVEVQDGKLMLYGSTDADASAEFAVQVSGVDALTTNDMLL